MPKLASGCKLTAYEILEPLGSGAMGEVWRARDTRLQREVAIKVLSEHFAADDERLKRFEREALTLAALNHPNVAQIYGVDQVDDTCFLVLELVPGESLQERLRRGALPIDEALEVARQIADGLEAAHEAGVIHRDLKPANVCLTPDGRAKVLDFGLARPARAADAGSSTDSAISTEAGRLLGTPTYMAPEQARGKPIDRRVDVWAFGCVLYECLTARRAFEGETLTDILGAVLHDQPDLQRLPTGTPRAVRELLVHCLEKDPRQRLRDIGDARTTLERARGAAPDAEAAPAARRPWLPLAWVLGSLLLAAGAWLAGRQREPVAPRVVRSSLVVPADVQLLQGDGILALSPDGRTLAFVAARVREDAMLWARALDSAVPQPLAGTANASYPFWSPDGQSLGFFADGKLKRIPARGGSVTTICDAPDGRGASWSPDDTILFAPAPFGPLLQVSAAGGRPAAVTQAGESTSHRLPHVLPDGRHALYTVQSNDEPRGIQLLDLATRASTHLADDVSEALFSPPGWLVFVRDNVLMVQACDGSTGRLSGDARRLTEPVVFISRRCAGEYALSTEGTLVYKSAFRRQRIETFDFDGHPLGQVGDPAPIVSLFASPDGSRLAQVRQRDDGRFDLWVVDTQRGLGSPLAEDVATPIVEWSPDGRSLAYTAVVAGRVPTVVRALDGSPARVLPGFGQPAAWSPDGRTIAIGHQDPVTGMDIQMIEVDGSSEPTPWMVTPAPETALCFSPDGRWLLVDAEQSGGSTLFAKEVGGAGAVQSIASGSDRIYGGWWLDDGRIVYVSGATIRITEVTTHARDGGLEVGSPRELPVGQGSTINWVWIARDGQRIYTLVPSGEDSSQVLTVVQDWRAALAGG